MKCGHIVKLIESASYSKSMIFYVITGRPTLMLRLYHKILYFLQYWDEFANHVETQGENTSKQLLLLFVFYPLTHYQTTNFRLLADNNFKFDKNGRKLTKLVENTVGKGEIVCKEQFLLFPQCFQKA